MSLWIGVAVILCVCVAALWDRHNAFENWFSTCKSVRSGPSIIPSFPGMSLIWGNGGGRDGSMGTSLASVSCQAVLYGKALAALLIGFVSFAFLASTIGISAAFSMLIAGLLFIVREELIGMIHRGFLAVPSFLLVDWTMFKLLWGCCGRRPPLEWNICGLNVRPIVVSFCLPMLTLILATFTGVHVSCDASHRDACWDALLSVISALLF